jgi:hypothetical protein
LHTRTAAADLVARVSTTQSSPTATNSPGSNTAWRRRPDGPGGTVPSHRPLGTLSWARR